MTWPTFDSAKREGVGIRTRTMFFRSFVDFKVNLVQARKKFGLIKNWATNYFLFLSLIKIGPQEIFLVKNGSCLFLNETDLKFDRD